MVEKNQHEADDAGVDANPPVAREGRIVDEDGNDLGDAGFHEDILGVQ